MNRYVKSIFGLACLFISANLFSLSDGAVNFTGADDGSDCTGCHTGAVANSDARGAIQLIVDSSNGVYIPGKTYQVRVKVSHTLRSRFGFALTNRLADKPFISIGSFIADSLSGVMNRFEYVGQKRISINAPQQKEWVFQWQAPADSVNKDITFYAAGVASNSDNNNTGDLVYNTKLTLKRASVQTGLHQAEENADFVITPNPANKWIRLRFNKAVQQIKQIAVYNGSGKMVKFIGEHELASYLTNDTIQLEESLPDGLYYLFVESQKGKWVFKFVLAR